MEFKTYLVLCLSALMFSCAHTHPGQMGQSLNSTSQLPLKLSAKTIGEPKADAFQLIDVTIENTSDKWVKISRSEVLVGNPLESHLSVVLGQDLNDWAQAMKLRLEQDEHNKGVIMATLLGAGIVAGAAGAGSNNKDLQNLGAVAIVGTYAWAATDVIINAYRNANEIGKVPDNHLHRPLSIPGKMFLRRWVLINKPANTKMRTLVIELETAEGIKDTYEVVL